MKPILTELEIAALCGGTKARRTIAASNNPAVLPGSMRRDEHKKLLRDADERVLPRRKGETDSEYGKRMYEHLNGAPPQPLR